ncbi:MAG: hypothetical protein E7351_03175 [Clostridiales bacterium]|nr:hypothetical protein [Clostridiales bacterium]
MIKILNVPSLYTSLYLAVNFCKKHENDNIEIIVPDKLSLFMEKFLFQHMDKCASFNIRVSTLNRFAKKSYHVDKEKQISKVASILLIHKILNEHINELKVLKSKAYSFSYAEDIFNTIGQLKASKISAEEMMGYTSSDSNLADKISDLALVYKCYEEGKAGLLDASDLFLISAFHVAKGRENTKILFVGFDDFTAIEYSIIEQLAKVTEVIILDCYSKADNKYIYNDEIYTQLKNIVYINELPFAVEDCEVDKRPLKKFLESNLFAIKDDKFTLTDDIVKVFSGNSVASEIEFVARDIRDKVLQGKSFDTFGVAIFGLDSYASIIQEIFAKYEINYYIDSEISLTKSILYKFFLSIFKYNLEGYNLSNLIDIINSPFFKLDEEAKRVLIERLTIIKFRGKIDDRFSLDIDEEVRNQFVTFMDLLIFDSKANAQDTIERLKKLDSQIGIDETLNGLSNTDALNKVLLSKSKEVIYALFDDILKINTEIEINAFYDIYLHIASVVKINNLPLTIDAVKVVDANNTMEIFDEYYIVNATSINAPNLKFDCGIILDAEIDKLNFSHKLSPTIAHINKLSKLRLYNVALLFERELTITHSDVPSELIKQILKKLQVDIDGESIELVAFTPFDYGKYVSLSKWDYVDYLCKNDKKNQKIDESIVKNKKLDTISQENLKIYDNLNIISASQLENYFKCPFYSFLANILKIKPRLDSEILSLDIGNLLHDIMYKYYKSKKQVGDIYEFCRDEIFAYVERDERLKLNADSPMLINLIDEATRVIQGVNYIDENSLFAPTYFEFDFKDKTALKLKNIDIIGKIDRVDSCGDMLRVIDYKSGRADASLKELYYGNKLQLFLYSLAIENILNKRTVGNFYLPLHNAYSKEVENTYSLKGFFVNEDFVVHALDKRLEPGMKSDIVNLKLNKDGKATKYNGYKELEMNEMSMLKNYAKTVSEQAVDEIRSGYIAPNPSEISKPCDYCDYRHICMKNSSAIKYRQASKVNLDSFKEVDDE